jgi:hypothetical protein
VWHVDSESRTCTTNRVKRTSEFGTWNELEGDILDSIASVLHVDVVDKVGGNRGVVGSADCVFWGVGQCQSQFRQTCRVYLANRLCSSRTQCWLGFPTSGTCRNRSNRFWGTLLQKQARSETTIFHCPALSCGCPQPCVVLNTSSA